MPITDPILAKLWFLIPEMVLFAGAVVVSVMGLSPSKAVRDLVPLVTGLALGVALVVTPFLYADERMARAGLLMPNLGLFIKMATAAMGIVLVMVSVGLVDRRLEAAVQSGRVGFDPIRVVRGEFYAFMLLSLTGLMLCASASDLIWLFLALELTSLPTYIMVAISRPSRKAQEAAVKYFFLGAMSAAIFLYGFALLYGATGTIVLTEMAAVFARQIQETGSVSMVGVVGMILAFLGISFKIAAAPMHFYTPDVYEGAASPVTAFLAFVPKAAGFVAIILLLATMGWAGHMPDGAPGLPAPVATVVWMVAVLSMTLGNVGALLQSSVKRMLAYSSIAHSGYMLIGIMAGPGLGVNAVLFYLLAYGVMNTAAFAVLAGLERRGAEIESLDDLAGLRLRHPAMAWAMAISAGSLIGMPPLLGFVGKLYLFIAGVQAGQIVLVVIAGINSAIAAWYYLSLVKRPILDDPTPQSETIERGPSIWPRFAAGLMAALLVIIPIFSQGFLKATESATKNYGGDVTSHFRVTDAAHDENLETPPSAAQ